MLAVLDEKFTYISKQPTKHNENKQKSSKILSKQKLRKFIHKKSVECTHKKVCQGLPPTIL